MKTEYRCAEALKEMMAEMPLDSISVTTLAKKCHVNRQTFYYHFHDIYDLLTLVFLNEEIDGLADVKTINELIRKIFGYYSSNKSFIEATLNSAGKELFEEFIHNVCYKTFLKFINFNQDSKRLHVNDRKAVARFYALAYSHTTVYYLSTYKNKTLDGLLNCFVFESEDIFEKAINKLLVIRSKQK